MTIRWALERPTDGLVAELEVLHRGMDERDPFTTPHFLRAHAFNHRARRTQWVAGRNDGALIALWPLAFAPETRRVTFSVATDRNGVLAANDVGSEILAEGLAWYLDACDAKELSLDNLALDGVEHEACLRALAAAGWTAVSFPAWECPLLWVDDPKALVRKVSGKSLRNYDNRLQREPGFRFSAERDGDDMSAWLEAFTDLHRWRWGSTQTPSIYDHAESREELGRQVRAWQKDGVLVRFGLWIGDLPIALAIGLLGARRVVYYHVAHAPDPRFTSAATVLIRRIALWAAEDGIACIDFGVGVEPYKRRFQTRTQPLARVRGTRDRINTFHWEAWTEQHIRATPALQSAWDRVGNQWFRQRLPYQWGRARTRLTNLRRSHLRTPLRVSAGRLRARVSGARQLFYRAPGKGSQVPPELQELDVHDVVEILDRSVGLGPDEKAAYIGRRYLGWRAWGIKQGRRVLQVCWLHPCAPQDVPPTLRSGAGQVWAIEDCFTVPEARGRGLYGQVLRGVVEGLGTDDEALIWTDDWNRASRRGIEKAGFTPLCWRRRRGAQVVWEPL